MCEGGDTQSGRSFSYHHKQKVCHTHMHSPDVTPASLTVQHVLLNLPGQAAGAQKQPPTPWFEFEGLALTWLVLGLCTQLRGVVWCCCCIDGVHHGWQCVLWPVVLCGQFPAMTCHTLALLWDSAS